MFSVILYMLRQTVGHRALPLLFPYFSPLTVTFPKLSVILCPLYCVAWAIKQDVSHVVRCTLWGAHIGGGLAAIR
jgi:hypothetical protein